MKRVRSTVLMAGLLLPTLAACGSSSGPPFTVACTTRKLPSGFLRANVTVTNTTSSPATAFVYSPDFVWVRHIYPFLRPAEVAVQVSHAYRRYIGFAVPNISPDRPAHLILRFEPPPQARSILATDRRSIQEDNWDFLNNPDCVIRRKL